jgi:hypothetical protein
VSLLRELLPDADDLVLDEDARTRDCQLEAVAYVHRLHHAPWKTGLQLTRSGVSQQFVVHLNCVLAQVGALPIKFEVEDWDEVVCPLIGGLATAIAAGEQLPYILPIHLENEAHEEEQTEQKEEQKEDGVVSPTQRTPEDIHTMCLEWYALFTAGTRFARGKLYRDGFSAANVTP